MEPLRWTILLQTHSSVSLTEDDMASPAWESDLLWDRQSLGNILWWPPS